MYIIATNTMALKAYQTQVDALLNYPEPLNSLINVGPGPHVDHSLCRAIHYAEISKHATEDRWALPLVEGVEIPEGAEIVKELPEGWYPEMEIMEG